MNILEIIFYSYAVIGMINTPGHSLLIENSLKGNNISAAMVNLGITAVSFATAAYSFSKGQDLTLARNKSLKSLDRNL